MTIYTALVLKADDIMCISPITGNYILKEPYLPHTSSYSHVKLLELSGDLSL